MTKATETIAEDQPLLGAFNSATNSSNSSYNTTVSSGPIDNDPSSSPLSPVLRWTTNGFALTAIFLFSGILFGWAPLELILLKEGQYAYLCDPATTSGTSTTTPMSHPLCADQTNALAGMFTMGQFVVSFSSFFVGIALDMLPKSVLVGICGVVEVAGLLLLGISDTTINMAEDGTSAFNNYFYLAYALLALGGSMTMLSAFPATFLLKDYQAGLLALNSCLFDGSSIVFSIFKVLQDQFGWQRKSMLLAYSTVAAVVYLSLIVCWSILEHKDWQGILKQEEDAKEKKMTSTPSDLEETTESPSDSAPVENWYFHAHTKWMQSLTLLEQVQTKAFVFVIFFVAIHMLQCNYYIMTIDAYLLSLGDLDAWYASVFSWVLPAGIIFVPFIERNVSKQGILSTLQVTNGLGLLFGLLVSVPSLSVQLFNFLVFTGFRAYLYSTAMTFIAQTFGGATMGRIIGSTFVSAAILSLVQYPLAVISETKFENNYLPVNVLLLGLAIIPVITTIQYNSYIQTATHDK